MYSDVYSENGCVFSNAISATQVSIRFIKHAFCIYKQTKLLWTSPFKYSLQNPWNIFYCLLNVSCLFLILNPRIFNFPLYVLLSVSLSLTCFPLSGCLSLLYAILCACDMKVTTYIPVISEKMFLKHKKTPWQQPLHRSRFVLW